MLIPSVRALLATNRFTIMATNRPITANMKKRPMALRSFLITKPATLIRPKVPAVVANAAVTALRS